MPFPKQADTCALCPTPMPRRANGRRPRCPRCSKNIALQRKYGITIEDYERMLQEQKGVCKLCLKPEKRELKGFMEGVPPLSVDHCHETGIVRGLLCYDCNHMLGLAHDDPEVLARAIEYLTSTIVTKKKK